MGSSPSDYLATLDKKYKVAAATFLNKIPPELKRILPYDKNSNDELFTMTYWFLQEYYRLEKNN